MCFIAIATLCVFSLRAHVVGLELRILNQPITAQMNQTVRSPAPQRLLNTGLGCLLLWRRWYYVTTLIYYKIYISYFYLFTIIYLKIFSAFIIFLYCIYSFYFYLLFSSYHLLFNVQKYKHLDPQRLDIWSKSYKWYQLRYGKFWGSDNQTKFHWLCCKLFIYKIYQIYFTEKMFKLMV